MRRLILFIMLSLTVLPAFAQEAGRTLKPNYRRIARVVADPHGPFFLDSLEARFDRRDTSLTVDHLRCLYYADTLRSLRAAHVRYLQAGSRFGIASQRAGMAWWRYQMLLTAVWSTGDGSRRKPLHVTTKGDALRVAADFGAPLWFKIKGRRKFSAAPPQ